MRQVDCNDLDEPDDIELPARDPPPFASVDEVMALQTLDTPSNDLADMDWMHDNSPHAIGDRNGEHSDNSSNFCEWAL